MSPGHLLQVGSRMAVVYGGGSGKGCVRVATSVGPRTGSFRRFDAAGMAGRGVCFLISPDHPCHTGAGLLRELLVQCSAAWRDCQFGTQKSTFQGCVCSDPHDAIDLHAWLPANRQACRSRVLMKRMENKNSTERSRTHVGVRRHGKRIPLTVSIAVMLTRLLSLSPIKNVVFNF